MQCERRWLCCNLIAQKGDTSADERLKHTFPRYAFLQETTEVPVQKSVTKQNGLATMTRRDYYILYAGWKSLRLGRGSAITESSHHILGKIQYKAQQV